jgi:hypothetical protein
LAVVQSARGRSVQASHDIITDFDEAEGDRIDLRGIDANLVQANDQAFTFLGTGVFTGSGGQLRFQGPAAAGDSGVLESTATVTASRTSRSSSIP